MTKVINHVRVLREHDNLSRRELATKVNTSHETIRRIEELPNYLPRYELMVRLADHFHTTPARLFETSVEPEPVAV